MLKITNTHSLAVQRKESKYRAWRQVTELELTPITMLEAPRHRIRQDAAIPLSGRKIEIFAEICRSLKLSYIRIK